MKRAKVAKNPIQLKRATAKIAKKRERAEPVSYRIYRGAFGRCAVYRS